MDSPVDVLPFKAAPSKQTDSLLDQFSRSKALFRNRYRVLRSLGRGGFGVTYLCRDMMLPGYPLCVTKVLSPKVSNPSILDKAKERFEREAKTLGQLGGHSHIPRLLEYFEMGGQFYLIQEYIRGSNLAKEIKLKGIQSENEVRTFLKEILPILGYVHSRNVIHRDIKPPNIIRCYDDDRLVLIDFGAVKEQITHIRDSATEETTQFVGTVGFAPPEQLALRPTFSSDIYSIGVTCLYLLTGKPPLEFDYNPTTGDILWERDVAISSYFCKVLTKMLKVSPHERYQTVDEVLRALDLESHVDDLAGCLNTTTLGRDYPKQETALDDGVDRSYVSPMARQAIAIRNWRQRNDQRHQPQQVGNRRLAHPAYSQQGF
ncbi:MAG: serine/threonine-protein kinase [Leptolyngbyaceae bacterium]|nr:serine/threonine-protein kinase [Leptolyngbyaceae bacterium]